MFFILHFWRFWAYYFSTFWNEKYINSDFTWALKDFEKSQELSDSLENVYNQWTTKYKKWNYQDAKTLLSKVATGTLDDTLKYKALHNLWNTLYQLWNQEQSLEKMKEQYEQSIQAYNDAISIYQDVETQKNKEFVERKLKELEEIQDNQSQTGSGTSEQEKTGSGSAWDQKWDTLGDSKKSWSDEEKWGEQSQSQSWARDEKYKLNDASWIWELSEKEKKDIENYQKKLEKFQKQNQWSFWVERREQQDFMDLFESNPFFRNDIWWSQKDW